MCLSPLLWTASLGLVSSQRCRGTYSFTPPMEEYFPVTKESETIRQTLEKSPLLTLLTTWGPNTQRLE